MASQFHTKLLERKLSKDDAGKMCVLRLHNDNRSWNQLYYVNFMDFIDVIR